MLKKVFLSLVAVSCFSCKDKDTQKPQHIVKKPAVKTQKTELKPIDIHDCTTVEDTVFSNGDWVKYVHLKDDDYGIQIKLGGILDTLDDYSFDCDHVNGLIPKTFRKGKELILNSGSGFTYRNIIVCSKKEDKIEYAQFESDRAHSEAADYFVFETQGRFCFYNRLNEKEFYREIPAEFKGKKVINSEVFEDKITIIFENKKTFDVALPKNTQ